MTPDELKARFKQFSQCVRRLARTLHDDRVSPAITNQLVRSGTSKAANYRAACLAISPADFASKVGSTVKEFDEPTFWIELHPARQTS